MANGKKQRQMITRKDTQRVIELIDSANWVPLGTRVGAGNVQGA